MEIALDVCVCCMATACYVCWIVMCEPHGWPQTLWLCSCAMVAQSASNGREEVEDDAWGHWTADPNVAVCHHEGPASQCQSVHGQKCAPMVKSELPVAKPHLLGLCAAPQKPTGAMAVATAPMARQQPEPTTPTATKRELSPDPPLVQQQQPVQQGPVLSHLVEALGQWPHQQTPLKEQQSVFQIA